VFFATDINDKATTATQATGKANRVRVRITLGACMLSISGRRLILVLLALIQVRYLECITGDLTGQMGSRLKVGRQHEVRLIRC